MTKVGTAPVQSGFDEADASLTKAEFCLLERMSPTTYAKLQKLGRGPQEVRIPGVAFVRITAQARKEWHARLEQWRQEETAVLEQERKRAQTAAAGKAAAASPQHVSKKQQGHR